MNKEKAKELIDAGEKLTHRFFDDGEWVTSLNNDTFIFEDGVTWPKHNFWEQREDEAWDEDWEIFAEPKLKYEVYPLSLNSTNIIDSKVVPKEYYVTITNATSFLIIAYLDIQESVTRRKFYFDEKSANTNIGEIKIDNKSYYLYEINVTAESNL